MTRPNYWSITVERSKRDRTRRMREQNVCPDCGGLGEIDAGNVLCIQWIHCERCDGNGKQETRP